MNKLLDSKTETEVVAYIARGDDYNTILKLLSERGINTTKATLTHIKKRNSEALEFMQKALTENQLSHASSILRKSRELLEHKLDTQISIAKEYTQAKNLFDEGEIDFKQYMDILERLDRRELTATELNSITKESFNQSQVEQGKPSAITESPSQAKANLQKLLNAINSGDERAAIEAIFPDA